MPSTMTDSKTLAAEFIQAFNAHDESVIKSLTAPNARLTAPGDIRLEGKEAVAAYAIEWLRAFPDARITVTNEIVSGPWIVQEYTFEGTHRATLAGPLGQIPATNKRVVDRGVQVVRFDNELATDIRLYFDMVHVLTQLGLMPVPARV
jgi:predicted ester cyclase